MKKRLGTMIVLTSLLFTPFIASCSPNGPDSGQQGGGDAEKITNVELVSPPSKLNYKEGEKFSASGMKVLVTYGNGETKTVRTGFEVDKKDPLTVADTKVVVTYEGYQFSFDITVIAVSLVSFTLDSQLSVTTYAAKSEIDLSALTFTATYSDETTESLTIESKGVSVKYDETHDFTNNSLGSVLGKSNHTVTVSYKTLSVNFDLEVVDGYKIEAEKMMNNPELSTIDSYIMAKLSASDTEYQPAKDIKDTGDGGITPIREATASGGAFLGGLKAGNVVEFYFKSDVVTTAAIEIAASSNWVKKIDNNNPSWVGDLQLNEVLSAQIIDAEGVTTDVTIADSVILPGGGSADNVATDKMLYRNFQKVEFGTMNVAVGWNKVIITYKTSAELSQLPVDSVTNKPKYQNIHNSNYGVPAIDYLQIKMN